MDFEGAVPSAHRQQAPHRVGCFVLCCSDTRSAEEDLSGGHIRQLLKEAGHELCGYSVVEEEPSFIRRAIEAALCMPGVEVLLTTGGTGIGGRDVSIEVVGGMVDKLLPGFGELFRMLSYEQIGSAAMLSRAMAGRIGGKFIFVMPGSKGAVDLAMRKLILPELGHVVREMGKVQTCPESPARETSPVKHE
ncbi:MAG: molybdenum cofactor biosynthesis protein MoaB [Proteobacteria bacterium]|nr:molybdenum cofactor biosynthesis protein MoaB [Cystobacterineae bacterium]MCL2259544.1 molybdenum cofactor biosynthesis protein MoaB [Cystobacterineae bacterium]MCL2313976.1 molybdenum cofactor biosynthesis protein MoaB [Pseudomonadota bacterium]